MSAPCDDSRAAPNPSTGLAVTHTGVDVAESSAAPRDGLVSLGVVASAGLVTLGAEVADPLIGLAITVVIERTWQSGQTIRHGIHEH